MCKIFLTICFALLGSIVCIAQTEPAKSKSSAKGEKEQQLALASDSSVQAQLQKTIDVKNAQVGDSVVLKTTSAIKQNGDVVVAKGSHLIGRITEVQQRTKQNATSKIGMIFDRVEGKSLDAPISASIISITNAAAAASLGDTMSSDISGGSRSSTSGSAGSSSGSGGLLGGTGGGLLGSAGGAVGGLVNTTTQTVGSVAGTAGQTVGHTTGLVGSGLNGIQLTNSASGSASGNTTLSTQNKTLRLEKGVMFNLLLSSDVSN